MGAQASDVTISVNESTCMHVDGEPFSFGPGEVTLSFKRQSKMLSNPKSSKATFGSEKLAEDLINWALENETINEEQCNLLMDEIHRRAGSRSRSRSSFASGHSLGHYSTPYSGAF